MNWKLPLRIAVAASALLSFPALLPRIQAEHPGPVVLIMDGEEVAERARAQGKGFLELMQTYRALGVEGVALYEQPVRSWVNRGMLVYHPYNTLRFLYPEAPLRPGWFYLGGPSGWLTQIAARWNIPTERVEFGGQSWLATPVNVEFFPAGYDQSLVRELKAQGFYLAARPLDHPYRRYDVELVPPEAEVVIFAGLDVLGYKAHLEEVASGLAGKPIAWIEGTPQRGFTTLAQTLPVRRLFSIRPEWQDRLTPAETADKFVLAARERGHQLLYLRPYREPEDTEAFLRILRHDLERSHIPLGEPRGREFTPWPLRHLAWIGVLSGLGLLALGLPQPLGLPAVGFLVLLALGVAQEEAGPLLAAMVFPALGFLERLPGLRLWLSGVLYSLAGAVFLTALGSTPESVLGLEPFRGVSLTLLVPPLLVGLSFLPRAYKPALTALYNHPLRLGEVGLALVGLALVGLAVLRRGNEAAPSLVPEWELQLRALLQDVMVRPRFKEIFAHALAPVALLLPWPNWFRNALLVLVAVGMGSILNTFSHYHTPLSISFFRVLNGILIGLALGLAGVWLVQRLRQWWFR
ncbi:MAG: DUF5693 family protein [Meiothermus sp.]|uniref:DUF5693 family protein n=1 Tax=Meiothermus sp. TaxID=1955249 RepID=UPI0025EAFA4C|nr:DUF5693 family protein [Meiothermus sp.]MCS7058574.1 DUF5693 family protein [Meiothermus sp.]MCS7193755.1 DUF5693 family protein [Meiothermus sp.]MCX7740510.1 DUF5693 family protein [Meiothermus sp.]MDW8091500.1 DUF5693 family protein [Meiothermus sp.]MDW8481968.1 DUF5693 family protein [Meiothermus sp.]